MQTYQLQQFLEYPNFALRLGMLTPFHWRSDIRQPPWTAGQRLWFTVGVSCLLSQTFGLLVRLIELLRTQQRPDDETASVIGQISEAGAVMGLTIAASVRMWSLLWHRQRITTLLAQLEQFFPPSHLQHHYRLDYFAQSTQSLMRRWKIFILFCFCYYNALPIVVTLYEYFGYTGTPFDYHYQSNTWYPWQTAQNARSFWCFAITYFCQMQSSLTGIAFIMAGEYMVGFFITQMLLHFDYLANALERLDARESVASQRLTSLIDYHNRLLRFCDEINVIFGISFFANFVTSSIAICLMGFSMVMISLAHTFKYSVGLLFFLICTLSICYNGMLLTEASKSLAPAAFYSNWYEGDHAYRKMILFFLTRTDQEIVLMASRFYTVSMDTFTRILKFSYQLFTFIRALS